MYEAETVKVGNDEGEVFDVTIMPKGDRFCAVLDAHPEVSAWGRDPDVAVTALMSLMNQIRPLGKWRGH